MGSLWYLGSRSELLTMRTPDRHTDSTPTTLACTPEAYIERAGAFRVGVVCRGALAGPP